MLTPALFFFAGLNGFFLMQAHWVITPELYLNAFVGGLCLFSGIVRVIKGQ